MYKGLIKIGTSTDVIYRGSEEKHIQLCYSHSVELFKDGQIKFLNKYRENFHDIELDSAVFAPGKSSKRALWY